MIEIFLGFLFVSYIADPEWKKLETQKQQWAETKKKKKAQQKLLSPVRRLEQDSLARKKSFRQ